MGPVWNCETPRRWSEGARFARILNVNLTCPHFHALRARESNAFERCHYQKFTMACPHRWQRKAWRGKAAGSQRHLKRGRRYKGPTARSKHQRKRQSSQVTKARGTSNLNFFCLIWLVKIISNKYTQSFISKEQSEERRSMRLIKMRRRPACSISNSPAMLAIAQKWKKSSMYPCPPKIPSARDPSLMMKQ